MTRNDCPTVTHFAGMTPSPSLRGETASDHSLTRREVIKTAAALSALVLSNAGLSACAPKDAPVLAALSPAERQLLEDVADTILPTTPSSPGAKAAKVGPVMALLLEECADPNDLALVRTGLAAIEQRSTEKGSGFASLSPTQREGLLLVFDAEAKQTGEGHWYHVVRRTAEQAFFSTETGLTKALRYVRVPGHFTGCLPLEPNQPAWG